MGVLILPFLQVFKFLPFFQMLNFLPWSFISLTLVFAEIYQPYAQVYYTGGGWETDSRNAGLATRGITQIAKGNAAVQKLLGSAKRMASNSKTFLTYNKNGNYETALRDFNSVHPEREILNPNIHHPTDRLVGTVGYVRLVLMKKGDSYSKGLPVLQIRSPMDKMYKRVVYKIPKI